MAVDVETHERSGSLYELGVVPYLLAWRWQQQLLHEYKQVLSSSGTDRVVNRDSLILLQHPAVYTLGQGADARFLRFDPISTDYELHRVERGGEVTHHCLGQLVGYPMLNLKRYRTDLHWYLRQLEEVLILTLAEYGLVGERIEGLTGVWVQGRKVAAIGIKVSRWITMHGFALNVCPDLSGFGRIVPCGIEGRLVGSMAELLSGVITVEEVTPVLVRQFESVFGITLLPQPDPDLSQLLASDAVKQVR
ncbi:MAG: lipoyl(octanoyl) transferase LipB [Cyanobacteria bacterium J06649_4]